MIIGKKEREESLERRYMERLWKRYEGGDIREEK